MLLRTASDIFWPFLTQDDYIGLISSHFCEEMLSALPMLLLLRVLPRWMENSGESSLFARPWAKLRHGSCVLCLVTSCDILSHLARSRTTPISSVLHLDSPTVPAHHELALRQEWGFWVSATFYVDRLVIFKLVNLSTACEGYPMAFLATWAFTSRCGLILLIAISLRPAPSPVQHQGVFKKLELHQSKAVTIQETKVEEHHMERETREQFLGSFKMIQYTSKCYNASMREHFEVWRSSGTALVRFFLGFLARLFRLHSEHGIKGVFDWSVMICDDLCVIACHCLPFCGKGCYVGLLRRPIRGHPHLQLSWCRIVATASWTASTSRRFSWFQSISHISMGYAEHWLCWKCYSVQGPCHRAQSLPGWSWQVRFASLQAKSSSTYGTAGQKIIENHGTSWKIQIARPAQQCWKILKDVESLSALQGHSSEDRGRLGGDGGEASRSCSRWRDENSCLTRWLSSGPRETRLHQKGISLRDIFCNCHVSDILSLSSIFFFASLRQIYAEESESAEAPNEARYWNVEDTEQQLHLESSFFVWDLCIDLQGGRRMDGSPFGGLKEPERSWEVYLNCLHPLKNNPIWWWLAVKHCGRCGASRETSFQKLFRFGKHRTAKKRRCPTPKCIFAAKSQHALVTEFTHQSQHSRRLASVFCHSHTFVRKISSSDREAKRHHSVKGGCPQLDVHWLLLGPLVCGSRTFWV